MAKRGRPPAGKAITDLDPAILKDIKGWVDSDKRHTATSVYQRFNLIERDISLRSFQRWVSKRRKANAANSAEAEPPAAIDRSSPEDLMLSLLIERAEAGDPKHFASIGSALRALCDYRRLGFEEAAEKRAQEIHEEKMAEARKRKTKADSEMDRISVKGGIPDKVRDAVKNLYGIALEPVTRGDVHDMVDQTMRGTTVQASEGAEGTG